ncbi:MAG: DUF6493 family protein [Flavobacteriaceae bacterium]|nr:DUF6493 family protein [Flavobacteriaceae bacterium]
MLEKELEKLILKERDVIPFLKKLSPKDKKEISPFVKKLHKEITEIKYREKRSGGSISFTPIETYTANQRKAINMVCFVCLNKTDLKRVVFSASAIAVDDYCLEHIIPWYKPKWYSNLINEDIPWGLSYEKMMRLSEEGLIELSHNIIVNKLPDAIVQNREVDNRRKSFYLPEVLTKYKVTLNEHIWLLFEEETSINNYYNYLHLENYKGGNHIWIDTFINLTKENKLDRKRVLIAAIYSSTKGFNKSLSGWFFDLLLKLNPSKDEILTLQDEFFAALNSPHSKVINTVLKYFKLVANHKKFKYKIFVENASILLNSETKSVVHSTLMILDKIAKNRKTSTISVCKKAAEALINIDEKIQLRAAKIIEKYGSSKKQELLDEIQLYSDNLFHSSRKILEAYIVTSSEAEVEEEIYAVDETEILSKEAEIPILKTLDDFIFFVSQSIDNNEVYHIDLLLSYLPKLYPLLNKNNVAKLEPIFKRSFDLSMNFDGNSQIGSLESEAAYYINDFAEILMREYPSELASFKKNKAQKIKKFKENRFYSSLYKERLKQIEKQAIPDYIYQIHHILFVKSKSLIKKGLALDLLSTPTHVPCWVAPNTLIDRIIAYEENHKEFHLYDFQIAMGRLPIQEYSPDIVSHIGKIKSNEIKKVLKYHFNQLKIQNTDISRPELWLQSVLSRNVSAEIKYFQDSLMNPLIKEMGNYTWDCKKRDHFYKEYDYVTRKHVQKKMIRKQLKLKGIHKKEAESIVSSIIGLFHKKKIEISSIYQYMRFKKQRYYTVIPPHDDVKFLFLSPNNPSMFLSHVIHYNMKESTFFNETSKKNMVNLLKGLYEIWHRDDFKESTYLFLATGFLCSHKVARELASELWIKANAENKIDNVLLGQILGKLELGEYAPLKRFTDLLTTNLFHVSKKHNKALLSLLDHMIANMANTPIRGVKKLLEIFVELKLSAPNIGLSQLSKDKLEKWKAVKSLRSTVAKVL